MGYVRTWANTSMRPATEMARMSTFSMTGGSTAATAFRAFSNRLPKVLMASRIVGLFSASCVSSIDRIMDWTPRVIAAPILSKVAPQLAPASLAAPDRDGNRDMFRYSACGWNRDGLALFRCCSCSYCCD